MQKFGKCNIGKKWTAREDLPFQYTEGIVSILYSFLLKLFSADIWERIFLLGSNLHLKVITKIIWKNLLQRTLYQNTLFSIKQECVWFGFLFFPVIFWNGTCQGCMQRFCSETSRLKKQWPIFHFNFLVFQKIQNYIILEVQETKVGLRGYYLFILKKSYLSSKMTISPNLWLCVCTLRKNNLIIWLN